MQLITRISGLGAIILLAACGADSDPQVQASEPRSEQLSCDASGYLQTEIYGSIRASLHWKGSLQCDGMPRPNGEGARLRFAGLTAENEPLALILGLPDLFPGTTGVELPTNVTLIAENQGRFFSTPDTSNCWTDALSHDALDGDRKRSRISGALYCVAALAEVNGASSITLGDLKFAGVLDWQQPE